MCGAFGELHATARLTMNEPMYDFEHDIARGYQLITEGRTDEVSHSRLCYFFGAGLIGFPFTARSPTGAISTITRQEILTILRPWRQRARVDAVRAYAGGSEKNLTWSGLVSCG
jgi:hypothetical protein